MNALKLYDQLQTLPKDDAITLLSDTMKAKKNSGMISFAKLIRSYRQTIWRYNQTKSQDSYKDLKKLSEQIDRTVEAVLK